MKAIVIVTSLMLVSAMLAQGPAVPDPAGQEIRRLPQDLASAWGQADARAMAGLFTEDGDLVIPSGDFLSGRSAIQDFYQSVFEHGYAGSRAVSEIKRIRVGGAMAVVDGAWSITGAKDAAGAPRPAERGLFTAVLKKQGGKWYVMALREMVPRND
jgi:uncharacterized protein (TIGR02246 family)